VGYPSSFHLSFCLFEPRPRLRLCNAPASSQRMMHYILRDFLHKFIIVYFDDVCVYIRTLEEHMEHLRLILQRFKEEGLKLRLKKCFFGIQEVGYLDYIASARKMSVSTKKVEAVAEWLVPTTQKEVRSSCNSANSTLDSSIILATLRHN
jgi:hypothetical protein